MATVYITEYAAQSRDARGAQMVVAEDPPAAEQTVAIGAGSVQSNSFNALTRFIRIHTDAVCSVSVGLNPTATATTRRMAANTTEYFGLPAAAFGLGWKIAVILNT